MAERTFVIVGASLAGAKAAQQLRERGFDGRVVLVGAETRPPYERPPLSKGFLLGTDEQAAASVHDIGWYADHDVELILGARATALDRAAHTVSLDIGGTLHYDKLLLATGSRVRELPVPGAHSKGVYYLRTMDHSVALKERFRESPRVVIIGAGWIGLEVAAAARQYGAEVTVVAPEELPLQRVLGDEVATIFRDLHEAHGVTFRLRSGVTEIKSSGGAASHVVLDDGTQLAADLVVIGIGVRPNIELAQEAGLEAAQGILTDEYLRSSDPDIYAAGDVAEFSSPLLRRRIRVEHWANALHGGPAAAASMLGLDEPYDRVPYFFTDQYTAAPPGRGPGGPTPPAIGMEYAGYVPADGYDRVVFRGSTEVRPDRDPEFLAFWTKDGRILAGMNANIWDVQDDQIQPLVRAGWAGEAVDLNRLADSAVPLSEVVGRREYA